MVKISVEQLLKTKLIDMDTYSDIQSEYEILLPLGKLKYEYEEIENTEDVIPCFEKHLFDYNKVSSTPMDLVIFGYAAEHLSRLVRILIMEERHALLVGMIGSGRQSLARLAAHIVGRRYIAFGSRGGPQRPAVGRGVQHAIRRGDYKKDGQLQEVLSLRADAGSGAGRRKRERLRRCADVR